MHISLRLALALSVVGTAVQAQGRMIRPGGASTASLHARRCESQNIEMVEVRPVTDSAVAAVPDEYLERAANEIFFYFNPPEVKRPRYAIVRLVARANGSVSALEVVESSQNDYFDREVTRALGEAALGRAFVPLPPAIHADSLPLQLAFGRHAEDAKSLFAKRTVCPAWPRLRNPAPDYPAELRQQGVRGFVRARFMVTADGKVKPDTIVILQATNKRFERAVEEVLPRLEFMPAEVQGRKVEQLTEQLFSFGLEERLQP